MKVKDFFKTNRTELGLLSKLKLKISPEIEMEILEDYCKSKNTSYFSFLQKWRGKVIQRTFACRLYKAKKEYQEVIRRIEGNDRILVKNMYYGNMAGYRTIWSNTRPKYYYFDADDLDKWVVYPCIYFNVYMDNKLQAIDEIDPSLKYCGLTFPTHINIIDFITIYRKEPILEILAKLNRLDLMYHYKFILQLKENKNFRKWFFKNKSEYAASGNDLINAYKKGLTVNQYRELKGILRKVNYVVKRHKEINKKNLTKYFQNNNNYFISGASYCDLIVALKYFHLDLNDPKNAFPKDFRYWHDYYTNQMIISKDKELDNKISNVASKYSKLASKVGSLKLILPTNTDDFIKEGECLHHCVGRMGYNKKMASEQTLIFFVRKVDEVDTPYVTMEFDISKRKILQLYADHDSKPEKTCEYLIYSKWLPKARRLMAHIS